MLTVGEITFPRDEAERLRDIRTGKYTFKEVENLFYNDVIEKVKKAKEITKLRQKPNEKKVWEIYTKIIVDFLRKDKRFIEK